MMKVDFGRVIAASLLAAAMGLTADAAEYQCRDSAGCSATRNKGGETKTVIFRKGDLVNTGSGWTVDPNDGWVKVPPGVGFGQ